MKTWLIQSIGLLLIIVGFVCSFTFSRKISMAYAGYSSSNTGTVRNNLNDCTRKYNGQYKLQAKKLLCWDFISRDIDYNGNLLKNTDETCLPFSMLNLLYQYKTIEDRLFDNKFIADVPFVASEVQELNKTNKVSGLFSYTHNNFIGGSDIRSSTKLAKAFNISYVSDGEYTSSYYSKIKQALDSGNIVSIAVQSGTSGHFTNIIGYDDTYFYTDEGQTKPNKIKISDVSVDFIYSDTSTVRYDQISMIVFWNTNTI